MIRLIQMAALMALMYCGGLMVLFALGVAASVVYAFATGVAQ